MRFTLRQLLGVTTTTGVIFAAGKITGSTWLVLHLCVIFAGWMLIQFAHVHAAGIVPTLFGADVLILSTIPWVYRGQEDSMGARDLIVVFGSFFVICGLVIFFVIASLKRRHWKAQAASGVATTLTFFAWCLVVPSWGQASVASRQARDTAANTAARAEAIAQVEAVRKKLGRIPEEHELAELLEKPLPVFRWDGFETRIRFQKLSDARFQVDYCHWDIFVYDSATPGNGWVRVPF